MSTNRELYINNANNEELAATIMAKVSTMPRFSNICGFTDAAKELAEWLSEPFGIAETNTQVPNFPNEIKKIELTEQTSYKDILTRLDKLEKK